MYEDLLHDIDVHFSWQIVFLNVKRGWIKLVAITRLFNLEIMSCHGK